MTIQDVKFNLWAVLIGMIILGGSVAGYLNAEQRDMKKVQTELQLSSREQATQYKYIIEKLGDLTAAIEKQSNQLDIHRNKTERSSR